MKDIKVREFVVNYRLKYWIMEYCQGKTMEKIICYRPYSTEKGLKSLIKIMDFPSVSFYIVYFKVLLLDAKTFRIFLSSWTNDLLKNKIQLNKFWRSYLNFIPSSNKKKFQELYKIRDLGRSEQQKSGLVVHAHFPLGAGLRSIGRLSHQCWPGDSSLTGLKCQFWN